MKDLLSSLGLSEMPDLDLGALTLEAVLRAALTLLVCLIAMRLVMSLFRRLLSRSTLDENIRYYILSGIRVVLWIVITLIVADSLGIPVTSLIALLSVFSLAVSLAVQSVLANLAGGIVLMINKPFQEGDFVETPSGTGTVQRITLNYTYLETPEGFRVVIPNSTLSAERITNYTTFGRRRIAISVTASYDAPTATVRAACLDAIARVPQILSDPAPEVLVNNYGESSIEYLVRVWCKPNDYSLVLFPLTEQLRETFREHGVEMTYNHLNVHIVEK